MRPRPAGSFVVLIGRHGANEPGLSHLHGPGPSRQHGGLGRSTEDGYYNGKQVDQGIARKAQQEPEGEMEGTETAAAAEATQSVSIIGFVSQRTCIRI